MRSLNYNLFPASGSYSYVESDGSRHHSDGWAHLAEKIQDYRAHNGLPIGNPIEDITNQQCAAHPSYCREEVPFVLQQNPSGMTLNQHVLAWLAHMLGYHRLKAIRRTDPAEATRRANICKSCPMQTALNTSCGACITMVDVARKQIAEGDPLRHQNLHPCAVLGEDMVLSVEINQSPAVNPALPGHCWRKA